MKIPPPRPEDLTPRRCEDLASGADDRTHGERSQEALGRARSRSRRRRDLLAGVYAATSCPTFLAGLWATGEYGDSRYGFAGTVLAVGLLWVSARIGSGTRGTRR